MSWETILATLGVKRLGEILAPFGIRLCEAMLIKKTAEARAKELQVITTAVSDAEKILPPGTTIEYNKEGFTVTTKTDPAATNLIDRTRLRVGTKDLRAQICLEGVVAAATEELAGMESVPDQKPDTGWTTRFLGYAEGMPESYLQDLWGKVLAGEVKQPGSYSLRTLDVLSAMTQKEAEHFVAACQYTVWAPPGYLFIPRNAEVLLPGSGLNYHVLSTLADIGLFHQGDMSVHPFRSGATEAYFGFSDQALAVTQGQQKLRVDPGLSVWNLTRIGSDLIRLFDWESPPGYLERFRDKIEELGWESRVGKIPDYFNPKFEEST